MIQINYIQDKLMHLIGWERSYGSSSKVASYLENSESGLYFQNAHPLITLDNLMSIAPNFDNAGYDAYNSQRAYKKNDIATYNGVLYKAKVECQNVEPTDENYWNKTDEFSEWLCSKVRSSIQKAVLRFCNEKLAGITAKNICENKTLFSGTGRIYDTIENKKNYVGFELDIARYKGVTLKINRIGLQFTKPGLYKIYIMHSSSYLPVYTYVLEKTKPNTLEWFEVSNALLRFESQNLDAGGSWYIVYSQDELPTGSMAIQKDRDWSKKPCEACSAYEYESYLAWSKYLEVHPFFVNSEFVDNISDALVMWDIEKNQYTNFTNYGINLDVTVGCDITDFIIEQRSIFQDVILKQFAIDTLKEFMYNANVRTNRHSINASRQDIAIAIDGDDSDFRKSGLAHELNLAFKALDFSTRGISKVCLPCRNNGVKYRAI